MSKNGAASLMCNTPTGSTSPTSPSLAVQVVFSRRWGFPLPFVPIRQQTLRFLDRPTAAVQRQPSRAWRGEPIRQRGHRSMTACSPADHSLARTRGQRAVRRSPVGGGRSSPKETGRNRTDFRLARKAGAALPVSYGLLGQRLLYPDRPVLAVSYAD